MTTVPKLPKKRVKTKSQRKAISRNKRHRARQKRAEIFARQQLSERFESFTVGKGSAYNAKTFPPLARDLCLLGATNADLGEFFAHGERTVERWIREKPEFRAAVLEGRELADAKVAKSLYRRATGWEQPAVKIMQHEGQPVIVDYTERFPADTGAAIHWLNNRRPDNWRSRSTNEVFGKGGGPIQITVSDKEAKL